MYFINFSALKKINFICISLFKAISFLPATRSGLHPLRPQDASCIYTFIVYHLSDSVGFVNLCNALNKTFRWLNIV